METIIKATHIKKEFHSQKVIKDISIDIKKGECIAFTGKNGCGKSTLLKILCGLSNPSAGKLYTKNCLKISYIPERFPKLNFTVMQYLMRIGSITGLTKNEIIDVCNTMLLAFHIQEYADASLKNLSKGSLQKVAIIQALLNDCDVLFMDEPLLGQDKNSVVNFINLMRKLKEKNRTIVMSCHEEILVSKLADKVYSMSDGCLKHLNLIDYKTFQRIHIEDIKRPLSKSIETCVCKIDYREDEVILTVNEEECNYILNLIIKENIRIKEIDYENIIEFD